MNRGPTRRRPPQSCFSSFPPPRLEDLVRDGVDQTDGRKRPADDRADARHEVVPALARRAHGDGHGAQVVGELRLRHVELVVGHRLRLDERLVADGRRRVRACVKIKILRGVHAIDADGRD